MGIAVDIVILAICVFTVIRAYKKGLVKSVMGFARGLVSLIAAYAFTPTLAEFIYDKFLLGGISGGISESIASLSKVGEGVFDLDAMFAEMPETLSRIIGRYGTDSDALGKLCDGLSGVGDDAVSRVSEFIASPVANGLSVAIAFILLIAVFNFALGVLTFIVDAIFHLPVLNGANKLLGLGFGIAQAAVLCIVLGYAASLLMGYLGSLDGELFGSHAIDSSLIMRTMSSFDLFGINTAAIN